MGMQFPLAGGDHASLVLGNAAVSQPMTRASSSVQVCVFACLFQRLNHRSELALPWNSGTSLHFLIRVLHCWMASNKAQLSSHKTQIFPSDTGFFPWITRS